MTQVDFYVLKGDSDDARLRVACRIAEKAMLAEQHVFVRTATAAEARRLDELLWTFSDGSFVPHRIVAGGETEPLPEPVLIGVDAAPAGARPDVLVNLCPEVPGNVGRYTRVAEVVDAEPERRRQGRERYRYYRDSGFTLATHEV